MRRISTDRSSTRHGLLGPFGTAFLAASLAWLPACGSGDSNGGGSGGAAGDGGGGPGAGGGGGAGGAPLDLPPIDADPAECMAGLEPTGEWFLEDASLESADGSVQVRRARQVAGFGVGETFIYELVRVSIVRDGAPVCIADPAELDYEGAHHNWDETMTAIGPEARYVLREVFDVMGGTGWATTIEAFAPGGDASLWGPLELADVDCFTVPSGNLNACTLRQRSDI